MALVNVILNNSAGFLLGDKTKVRIRIRDQHLQFRPTHRRSEANLPKGERLRPIRRTGKMIFFTVKEEFLEADRNVSIEELKYGWYMLEYTEHEEKNSPSAKLISTLPMNANKQRKASKPFDEVAKRVSVT